jgi:hypothetical protein
MMEIETPLPRAFKALVTEAHLPILQAYSMQIVMLLCSCLGGGLNRFGIGKWRLRMEIISQSSFSVKANF